MRPYLNRPIMSDRRAETELCQQGFTLVDLLSSEEADRLYRYYAEAADQGDLNPPGAYNEAYGEFTIINSRPDFRREAFAVIEQVVGPRVEEHLQGLRPVIANFVNKPPGGGLVPVHQNISVVEEGEARSVSVWIALVDCTVENGTLQMAGGTHHLRGKRGPWAYEEFLSLDDLSIKQRFTPVPVRAGQAIVLDDALVHYSAPNETLSRRLAIQLVMLPEELDAVYYECISAGDDYLELDRLAVEPAYFFDFWDGKGDRAFANLLERVSVPRVRYDAATLDRCAGEGPGSSDEVPEGSGAVARHQSPRSRPQRWRSAASRLGAALTSVFRPS